MAPMKAPTMTFGFIKVDLEVVHEVRYRGIGSFDHLTTDTCQCLTGTGHRNLDLLNIRSEQGKGSECRRTDGKALSGSGSGIS